MLRRYARWLHTGWPAGRVETLPEVGPQGACSLRGVRITGDLTGIPLLKLSSDSGARAVRAILAEKDFRAGAGGEGAVDLAIVGAGVSGVAAAMEARTGLSFAVYEAGQAFSTIVNFPARKPIFTYPTGTRPAGDLQYRTGAGAHEPREDGVYLKEDLVEELEAYRRRAGIVPIAARVERLERRGGLVHLHLEGEREPVRAQRVIVAIGRSGNFRRLGVPGEDQGKVSNRLHDPKDFAGRNVLVVGGGDSAVETAVALAFCGASVTLSYRGRRLSRPKPENLERLERIAADPGADVQVDEPVSERVTTAVTAAMTGGAPRGALRLALGTEVEEILAGEVLLRHDDGRKEVVPNDAVFTMIGREAPLDFFRRSGIRLRGEWTAGRILSLAAFLLFAVFLYNWKAGGTLTRAFAERGFFPFNVPGLFEAAGGWLASAAARPAHLLGTLRISLAEPGFYYSLAYALAVVVFGVRRVRRRRTPYVKVQTVVLAAVQVVPLFLLPYVLLPWIGHNGWLDDGWGRTIADNLFPATGGGQGREYWRAVGLVLAWPLFVWNVFTHQPMAWWLAIGFVQTFVLIPLVIWRWGKGAYCGWICSCGALAETMGDAHRHKMPHGRVWNRLNLAGQAILGVALLLLLGRALSWTLPDTRLGRAAGRFYEGLLSGWSPFGIELNYYHVVDITLAGILGVGLYFWFSGRVWCRFFCPLAALMHVYARFSRFRIFADKKKCISCNVCTSVCHQGIDVMNFANKGLPMEDPECVRCSACVESCPTGVLSFGRLGRDRLPVYDRLAASPVQMREGG